MNTAQKSVVALMKSALTGQAQPLPEGFSMEEVLRSMKSHHIEALIYEGATLCGVEATDPAMRTLFPKYCKSLQVSVRQMREVARLFRIFEENGIDYMPLKGCKLKTLYPKPELRAMGDADVLIRMEQYEKIRPLMQELGFAEKSESDHELVWQSESLYLELHKCLIPSYNEDFYTYFAEGWQLAKPENGTRYAMTVEDEWIFLFTHFAKHYRDGGIGCRYLADLWLYRKAHPDMDTSFVEEQLQKLQLLNFYRNVLHVIDVWFKDAQPDEKTDFITDFVFSGGSWGSSESKIVSRVVRDSRHIPIKFSARLIYWWNLAFPEEYVLREKYAVLKKHPWMLPLVWFWRPWYKLLFERDSLQQQNSKLDAITREKMENRRQALRYVGIDYNF